MAVCEDASHLKKIIRTLICILFCISVYDFASNFLNICFLAYNFLIHTHCNTHFFLKKSEHISVSIEVLKWKDNCIPIYMLDQYIQIRDFCIIMYRKKYSLSHWKCGFHDRIRYYLIKHLVNILVKWDYIQLYL